MGGVDPRVVVHICTRLEQRVDQFIVALSESHLQTVDGILVHHGSSLQQQAAALQIVVGHGKKECGPALIVIVTAHPLVKHEVWIVAGFKQRLHTMGMAPSSCRVEGTHATFLDSTELGHWDELLQSPVRNKSSFTKIIVLQIAHTQIILIFFHDLFLTVCGHGRPPGEWAGAHCK